MIDHPHKNSTGQEPTIDTALDENSISRHIVQSAIEVHRTLGGPGLLESIYEEVLVWELKHLGLTVHRQFRVPISYKGRILAGSLRIDLVVNKKVIVECKALPRYCDIFEAQVLTYLRLSGCRLGLVINFGERMVKDGIHRVVNRL
jgi:GxxExxY protein